MSTIRQGKVKKDDVYDMKNASYVVKELEKETGGGVVWLLGMKNLKN